MLTDQTALNSNVESTLSITKQLTDWKNNEPNNTIPLQNLHKNQIMKESRISVTLAGTFFDHFDQKAVLTLNLQSLKLKCKPNNICNQLRQGIFNMLFRPICWDGGHYRPWAVVSVTVFFNLQCIGPSKNVGPLILLLLECKICNSCLALVGSLSYQLHWVCGVERQRCALPLQLNIFIDWYKLYTETS